MLHFDQNRQLKWPAESDEHFVPLQSADLIDFLSQHPALPPQAVNHFRQFCDLILAIEHHLYRQHHERLLYVYSALDPDLDHVLTSIPMDAQRDRLIEELQVSTRQALQRANYRRLSETEIIRRCR
jgi:hypothetical protein